MKLRDHEYKFAMWVAARWWAGVLIGLVVVLVGVGLILNEDETGFRGGDTTWIKYTIAPLCIVAGVASVLAGLIRKRRGGPPPP